MGTNQNFIIAIAIAVALVVGGGLFLLNRPAALVTQTTNEIMITPSPAEDQTDLDSDLEELEETDIDAGLDAEMKSLDSETLGF